MFFLKPSLTEKLLKLAGRCESAFDLCEKADSIFQKPIQIVAYNPFRPHVQGSVWDVGSYFLILLKPTLTPLSIQLVLLHELSHICLGHLDKPVTISELLLRLSSRTDLTHSQEQAAQKLACKLFSVLIDACALSPPNPPECARFEELFR